MGKGKESASTRMDVTRIMSGQTLKTGGQMQNGSRVGQFQSAEAIRILPREGK